MLMFLANFADRESRYERMARQVERRQARREAREYARLSNKEREERAFYDSLPSDPVRRLRHPDGPKRFRCSTADD